MTDSEMLTINGLSHYYEAHGTGDPILFVHGFPLSGKLWQALVPALESDYRLIIPDLRGHGRSASSPEITMADFANDLAALLDNIGETRPIVLVGLSMGGYISFEFYRRYPDRVRALVLANTRAQADIPDDIRNRRAMAQRVKSAGSILVAEAMLPRLFGPQASEELKQQWIEIMSANPPEGIAAALGAIANRPDSFETLASTNCPVQIIVGEDDMLTPPKDAEQMRDAAPDARLKILSGSGHMSPVERPEAFLQVLRGFLDELPGQDCG